MSTTFLALPLRQLPFFTLREASNDASFACSSCMTYEQLQHSNVRLLRHPKEQDCARFVLSGKLADVCAALDEMAALEKSNALRYAHI